ncbi:MAG: hypothetical protein K0S77_3683 [Pseudomonas sp.]|jgi:hypothetical protein|nr:hypothetical protein [Pseudomonas sp.]
MTIDKQEIKALALACDPAKCADEAEESRRLAEFHSELTPEVVLALLAEIEQAWREADNECRDWAREVERRQAVQRERDQLKAENEALRGLVLSALEEGKGRPGTGGNAPGHCHAVPGVWDRGNGDRSGTACGWCRIWNAAQAMAKEASRGC